MEKLIFVTKILDLLTIEEKAYIVQCLLEEINDGAESVFDTDALLKQVDSLAKKIHKKY